MEPNGVYLGCFVRFDAVCVHVNTSVLAGVLLQPVRVIAVEFLPAPYCVVALSLPQLLIVLAK